MATPIRTAHSSRRPTSSCPLLDVTRSRAACAACCQLSRRSPRMPLLRHEREALVESQGLRRSGAEWKGGCVRCGRDDRFNVTSSGLVWCRNCGDKPGFYRAVMKVVEQHIGPARMPFNGPSVRPSAEPRPTRVNSPTKALAQRVLGLSTRADGTLADIYLSDRFLIACRTALKPVIALLALPFALRRRYRPKGPLRLRA